MLDIREAVIAKKLNTTIRGDLLKQGFTFSLFQAASKSDFIYDV